MFTSFFASIVDFFSLCEKKQKKKIKQKISKLRNERSELYPYRRFKRLFFASTVGFFFSLCEKKTKK